MAALPLGSVPRACPVRHDTVQVHVVLAVPCGAVRLVLPKRARSPWPVRQTAQRWERRKQRAGRRRLLTDGCRLQVGRCRHSVQEPRVGTGIWRGVVGEKLL